MSARTRAVLALVLLAALAAGNAAVQSYNPPRTDDIVYLRWAIEAGDSALAPFVHSPPYPGWRPAVALLWWLSERLTSTSALGAAVAQALLWLVAWASWTALAGRRGGPSAAAWTGALLLVTQDFRDLVTWRSWSTTTGALAMAGLALLALDGRRPKLAALFGVLAVLFKETAALHLAAASLLLYRSPAVALTIVLAAIPSFARFAFGGGHGLPPPGEIAHSALFYVKAALNMAWPVVGGILAFGSTLPVAEKARRAAVIAAGLVLPLAYWAQNPVYMLEATTWAAVWTGAALARRAPKWSAHLLAAATLLVSLHSLPATVENVLWQTEQKARIDRAWAQIRAAPAVGWRTGPEANESVEFLVLRLVHELGARSDEAASDVVWDAPGLWISAPH